MDLRNTSWRTAAIAGEPHSIIRVRDLQATVQAGKDAWGRSGKTQPVLISATISLRRPFDEASEEDSVNNKSTVHYGILSKAILEAAATFENEFLDRSLRNLQFHISDYLVRNSRILARQEGVLDPSVLRSLEVKVTLPKASLIGSGISLSGTVVYGDRGPEAYSWVLRLHDLRIPTLIGVNPNERLAKQIVVVNIGLDPWPCLYDAYNELEELVVKTIEESSFETLEALAAHVCRRITSYFIIVHCKPGDMWPRIKICLEKPTAVTFAEAPAVEILVDTDPSVNEFTERALKNINHKTPPFPLQGRLDEWIRKQDHRPGE